MIFWRILFNLKLYIKLNSATFQNCVKTEQYSCEDFMVMTFALQKLLRNRTMVKAFCYAKRSTTAPFSSGCILVRSIIFSNFSVSGKERARERKVIGHDFRKRKLLTQLCHLAQSVFAILRASSLAKTPLRLVKPQNIF